MARTHGFRIYLVQVFPNQEKGNDALDVSVGSRAHDMILDSLERLHSEGTYFYPARKDAVDGLPDLPSACITMGDPQHVRSDLVHIEVSTGTTGSHNRAVHEKKKKPKKLHGYAPEATHNVTFLFPEDVDDRFLVICQTKNGRDPIAKLRQRLTHASYALKQEAQEAEKADRAKLKQAGSKMPPKKNHYKLVYRIVQAVDNAYLDELFRNAKEASASFTSYTGTGRGSGPRKIQRQLSIRLRGDEVTGLGRRVAQVWRDGINRSDTKTAQDGVSELAGALLEEDLLDAGEASQYEEAKLTLVTAENDRTDISVDSLRDAFTYPVSNGSPPYYLHYERVSERVAIVAREAGLEVGRIDPHEVSECLTGSTPAT